MLTPRADGAIVSKTPVLLPVMAPRLQADVYPDGAVDLSLWGVGKLGRVRFAPLAGPYAYGPNRAVGCNGGVHVAQSAPVMLIEGGGSARVFPARRCAWWHEIPGAGAQCRRRWCSNTASAHSARHRHRKRSHDDRRWNIALDGFPGTSSILSPGRGRPQRATMSTLRLQAALREMVSSYSTKGRT